MEATLGRQILLKILPITILMATKKVLPHPPPMIWITCPKMKRNQIWILGQCRIPLEEGGVIVSTPIINSLRSLIRQRLGHRMRSERHPHRYLTRMRGRWRLRASSSILLSKVSSWNKSKSIMKVRISSPSLSAPWQRPWNHSLEGALKVSRSNPMSNQGGGAWPNWSINLSKFRIRMNKNFSSKT